MTSTSTPSRPSTTTTTSSSSSDHPSDLETDLLTHLLTTPNALDDLHNTLLSSLQRTGWTERVRKLAQELLRGGRCERFDEVIEAVVASAEGRRHPSLSSTHPHPHDQNPSKNGRIKREEEDENNNHHHHQTGNGRSRNDEGNDDDATNNATGYFENVDVRIPSSVVEQGVRAIKEVLREVVVLEGDDQADHSGSGGGGGGGGEASGNDHATTTTKTPGAKDRIKGVKNGETNGTSGASGSPVKKADKKVKAKQAK